MREKDDHELPGPDVVLDDPLQRVGTVLARERGDQKRAQD